MGQTLGRATLVPAELEQLANLPKTRVYGLWNAFNDVAEGFGLGLDEVRDMLRAALKGFYCTSETAAAASKAHTHSDALAAALFTALDDDCNDLVDALELLAALALLSGMSTEEKVRYVFMVYDFDDSRQLNVDECILAMRSTVSGICKMSAVEPPLDKEVESIATAAFTKPVQDDSYITLEAFTEYCLCTPEVLSWIQYVGDVPQQSVTAATTASTVTKPTVTAATAGAATAGNTAAAAAVDPIAAAVVAKERVRAVSQGFHSAQARGAEEEYSTYVAATDLEGGSADAAAIESRSQESEAQRQWENVVAFTEPSVLPKGGVPSTAPPTSLVLEWAHGYSTVMASRDAAHYTGTGEIVYPAGAVGVVFTPAPRGGQGGTQQYYQGHTDSITCLACATDAVNRCRTLVATGQLGRRPKVTVWVAEARELVGAYRGQHRCGVSHIRFSSDCALLLSIGMETATGASLVVRHWSSNTTLFTAVCSDPQKTVAGLCWAVTDRFVTCGVDHVTFWDRTSTGTGYERSTGLYGPNVTASGASRTQLCCIGLDDGTVVTAGAQGYLLLWHGRNCIKCIKGHAMAVTTITAGVKGSFATGSADGKVQLWRGRVTDLEALACFDARSVGAGLLTVGTLPAVHSLSWHTASGRLLVGIEGGDLFEISDCDGTSARKGPVTTGHSNLGGLHGLACHPTDPDVYCTAGADKTVRVWSRLKKRSTCSVAVDTAVMCCAYHPDGVYICIGLGNGYSSSSDATDATITALSDGSSKRGASAVARKVGAFVILRAKDLTVVHEARDSKYPINAVAWSPDGGTLAVASEDGSVYLYTGQGTYVPKSRCNGHKMGVSHIDFSVDSKILQSHSAAAHELLFFDTERGEQVAPSKVRDVQWETQTCCVGWCVRGAWNSARPCASYGAPITAVGRSCRGESLVIGDSCGSLRLMRYPAAQPDQGCWQYRGHGSDIRGATWCADDAAVISISGRDCCILQWHHAPVKEVVEPRLTSAYAAITEGDDESDLTAAQRRRKRQAVEGPVCEAVRNGFVTAVMDMEENPADGSMFAPQRPWHKAIAAPSDSPVPDLREPYSDLSLEWVHGFTAKDCRGLAQYTNSCNACNGKSNGSSNSSTAPGTVVFAAGTLAVVMTQSGVASSSRQQRVYSAHTNDITSMALHPVLPLVATGQQGVSPITHIWDIHTMSTVRVLQGCRHKYAITALAFSNTTSTAAAAAATTAAEVDDSGVESPSLCNGSEAGVLLVTVGGGGGACCTVTVWHWQTRTIVASMDSGTGPGRELMPLSAANATAHNATAAMEGRASALAIAFNHNNTGLIEAGDGYIRFWSFSSSTSSTSTTSNAAVSSLNLTCVPAALAPRGKLQPFYAIGWDGDSPVIGTYDGHLYKFVGRKLDKSVKAHEGEIWCVATTTEGIATGGRDGLIKLWRKGLELRLTVNLHILKICTDPGVRSLSWDVTSSRLLIGTAGVSLIELNAETGECLHKHDGSGSTAVALDCGHGGKGLWGVTCSNATSEYCTVGEDKRLRVWDIHTNKCIRSTELEVPSRAAVYSPDGALIAVGFGKPLKDSPRQFDGKWIVLRSHDFTLVHEARDSQKHIQDMKWSLDGALLAIAAADSKIYVYDCRAKYTLSAVIALHSGAATAIDFSADGKYIKCATDASELYYFEADTGLAIPAASRLKNTVWGSDTTPFSWHSQGVWPPQNDKTEVQALEATLLPALPPLQTSNGNDVSDTPILAVAAGDNYGRVRLMRYPATSAYAAAKCYRGHSTKGGVSRIRWTQGCSHMISIGAEDGCIMQWKYTRDDKSVKQSIRAASTVVNDDMDPASTAVIVSASEGYAQHRLEEASVRRRRWLESVHMLTDEAYSTSTNTGLNSGDAVELVWAHGAIHTTKRNGLAYTHSGEVASINGGELSFYSRSSNVQRFCSMDEGTDLARCGTLRWTALAVGQNGHLIATGSNGSRPRVVVWDTGTAAQVCELPSALRQGVLSLSFSSNGHQLVGVGGDADHTIAIWTSCTGDWTDGCLTATSPADRSPVHFAAFRAAAAPTAATVTAYDSSNDNNSSSDTPPAPPAGALATHPGYSLVTGGNGHVKFWTLRGTVLTSQLGQFEGAAAGSDGRETALCGACLGGCNGGFVTGAASGHMHWWRERKAERTTKAHTGALYAMHVCIAGLVTGGDDGLVKLWSLKLEQLQTYDITGPDVIPPPLQCSIRSLCAAVGGSGSDVLRITAGTSSGEVYDIARKSGSVLLLQEGHYGGELWGLATHPTEPDVFATAGDDGTVRIWSATTGRVQRKLLLNGPCRALTWSPDGSMLLAGGGDGNGRKCGVFWMIRAATLEVVFEGRDCRGWIRAVVFSPDSTAFALASNDGKVYLYDGATYALRSRCQGHAAPVTSVDFSDDSQFMQSGALDGGMVRHSVLDGTVFTVEAQLKPLRWSKWSCTVGWPVQAAWPSVGNEQQAVEPFPTTVCRSPPYTIASSSGSSSSRSGSSNALNGAASTDRYNNGYSNGLSNQSSSSSATSSTASLLACGYSDGSVRLFQYPAAAGVSSLAGGTLVRGCHGGPVGAVRFSAAGMWLISVSPEAAAVYVRRMPALFK